MASDSRQDARRGRDESDDRAVPATSFGKSIAVLVLVAEHGPIRADAIVGRLGLPLSSVYRYLAVLVDMQLVAASEAAFSPGPLLRALASMVPSRQRLIDAAQPVLEDLVVDTLETAVLSIRTGTHALCLAQADSPHAIKVAFRIGQLLPLHAGAGQRLLLAFAPPGVQDRVLVAPLRRYTAVTPSAEDLPLSLKEVRWARWAVSMGELIPGAVAVAAPVEHHGRVIAALTVAGPSERCTPAWQRVARAALDRASSALTRHLETF